MQDISRIQTGGISFYIQGKIRPEMCGGFMDDEAYASVLDHMIIVNVDVVVINRERGTLYLVKRAFRPMLGNWWWFGGRRKKGETPIQGICRSFKGETGLCPPEERFEPVAIIEYLWQEREQEPKYHGSHHIAHQFAIELTASELCVVQAGIGRTREYAAGNGLQEFDRARILAEDLHPAVLEVYDKVFPV